MKGGGGERKDGADKGDLLRSWEDSFKIWTIKDFFFPAAAT